jgi:4-amino-4-deoxychorismate lyase
MSASLNGKPLAEVLALHRGLQYGDGVFRTCMVHEATVVDLEHQCRKAVADAARLGMIAVDGEALRQEAAALARGHAQGVLKMLLLRAGKERGYRSSADVADRLLCAYPAPALPPRGWDEGVSVFRSPFRLATQPLLAGIKHLNRLEQVLACRDWEEGADEALVSDAEGRPVSGTRTNLFWVRGGALHTPELARCGVSGRMRERVLAAAAAAGIACHAGDYEWDDVGGADEVFLTNSLVGIWPVRSLGGRSLRAPGSVTRQLAARIAHPRMAAS